MPNPLSIVIATGLGGSAGKVAQKTWDKGVRWLTERFGSHAESVSEQARANAAAFVQELAEQLRKLEAAGRVRAEQIETNERHPQFSALLQDSLLQAAETNDESKHQLLADLVAKRLTAESETTAALAAPLATAAIARATRRQLQLLALACMVEEVRPNKLDSADHFRAWLALVLRPFDEFEFEPRDAKHLVALNCITFDPASTRDLSTMLNMKSVTFLHELVDLRAVEEVRFLQMSWDHGLAGVELTSVGSIIGGLALNRLAGTAIPFPDWE